MDLADIHAPKRIATTIHKQLGAIEGAIPVSDIARALDISEVRSERLDGCEGMLLTDRTRSQGKILVNTQGGSRHTRFSIAHELGHFLLERHVLGDHGRFECGRSDMLEQRSKTRHQKQELEANQFAISLLAPGYKVTPFLSADPDIKTVQKLSDDINVSLEATTRHFLALNEEPLAAVWSLNGRIRYSVRSKNFPWIRVGKNELLSSRSIASGAIRNGQSDLTEMTETNGAAWTESPDLELFEQTRVGNNGYALTLLWATLPNEDPDDDGGPSELGTPEFRTRSRRK